LVHEIVLPDGMKDFDQAEVRAASVNRTAIRCQHAANGILLRQPRIGDEKFQVFTIHQFHRASTATSCGDNARDRKMCIANRRRKMRRG
jgi:hypothetical protein